MKCLQIRCLISAPTAPLLCHTVEEFGWLRLVVQPSGTGAVALLAGRSEHAAARSGRAARVRELSAGYDCFEFNTFDVAASGGR
jgi:hypothetical protein